MSEIIVSKRSGKHEPFNLEKIHRIVAEACKGISGVSESQIEITAQLKLFNNIKTEEITETLIKSAADLITEDNPNYQYVASRLINYQLRKNVYGSTNIPTLYTHLKRGVECGFYDSYCLEQYTEEEINTINKFIWHDRDYELTYCAMETLRSKYLVRNRVTDEIFETPQMMYILIAATLFASYPKETRLKWVKDYYDAISQHYISLPTPVMAGVRTRKKQYASCTVIECGDSIDEIIATNGAIVKYVSQKAGIGLSVGRLRGLKSSIDNGSAYHTGLIPFMKMFYAAINSCSQGSIRKGSGTCHFPIWHIEIRELVVLKNNKGTEETRIRHMDYSVQICKLFYERLISGGDITLFSPSEKETPGLIDSFYSDQNKFKQLYEQYEKDPTINKKVIKAIDLFSLIMQERKNTGRIYIQNIDHCNTHSSFYEPITMSNLCQEITLATKPFKSLDDQNGLVGLCTLSAINWGKIKTPNDFEKWCSLAVRGLDSLLDIQTYLIEPSRRHTELYRPLGIGIINFAYFLAKNNVKYGTPECLSLVDEYAEAWSYYLIKTSNDIAKEKGKKAHSKYNDGIVPIDTRKKEVDELIPYQERMPWGQLRKDLLMYGTHNGCLMALMPSETSSQVSNSTNGIEPPRSFVTTKISKDGKIKQVVPEYKKLKNKYELLWDQKSPEGYLKTMAILQKYVDQSISVNTSYNPEHYPDKQLPMSTLISHLLLHYKWGGKTLYYNNTYDGQKELDTNQLLILDKPSIGVEQEEVCDSCVI